MLAIRELPRVTSGQCGQTAVVTLPRTSCLFYCFNLFSSGAFYVCGFELCIIETSVCHVSCRPMSANCVRLHHICGI